ncbi:hypothetical protein ABT024_07015 [Streptomyces sp. NPDC002812]|uniref:hypothetical protein n=1 Tax=Streptomyces sp. NPDC002812 TaxID=3154434 RepID=UPI00331BF1EE
MALQPPGLHVGRSWSGHEIEDHCPCPKAPCGLVRQETTVEECDEHYFLNARAMRQSHTPAACL